MLHDLPSSLLVRQRARVDQGVPIGARPLEVQRGKLVATWLGILKIGLH